jgi:hypothetical protein
MPKRRAPREEEGIKVDGGNRGRRRASRRERREPREEEGIKGGL